MSGTGIWESAEGSGRKGGGGGGGGAGGGGGGGGGGWRAKEDAGAGDSSPDMPNTRDEHCCIQEQGTLTGFKLNS